MSSTIITKNSSTASAVPLAGDLVKGELAVNVTDKKLYTKDNSATVVKVVGSLGNQEASAVAITGGTVAGVAQTGGTINNTPIGASTASTVRGTTVTATTGFVGDLTGAVTGNVTGNVTGTVTGNVTGNLTGNVTASSGTSSFNNVTINGTLDMNSGSAGTITGLATPSGSTDAANKGYVDTAISNLIGTAPGTLDTLGEIADALNDDANIAATLTAQIATKVSKSGDTMTGALAMGSNKITGLGTPTAGTDATTKTYVDTADALKLNLAGGTMSGAIAMGNNKITGLGTPTADADATTKVYVDGILGSATSAATSASAAATSATNAANSASAASASADSAAASASSAAATYDQFDDRYLGSKATAPTVDNDGNALLTGALYFDTTANEMRVYTGSAWKATGSAVNGTAQRQVYTATAGQTTFAITYDVGFVDVYLNGVKQIVGTDFTATSGTNIVFAAGLVAGDLVDIVAYGAFVIANTYTQAQTDSLLAGKVSGAAATTTVGGDLKLYEGTNNGTNFVALKAPNTLAANVTYTLPTADGTNGQVLATNGSGALSWASGGGGSSQWTTSGSDIYYTTGNVGVGTTSPARRFQVNSAEAVAARFTRGGGIVANNSLEWFDGTNGWYAGVSGSNFWGVAYNSSGGIDSAAIRLDSSGNLGLGVTPSAWGSGQVAFQIGADASLNATKTGSDINISSNARFDGSVWRYISSIQASNYYQSGGAHVWRTAPSGTAGNAISFTQAMTLNANGALVLQGGNTSANGVGITFPATQSASSNANTLDDYEEGGWTPAYSATGATINHAYQVGFYTKVGNTVYLQLFLRTSGVSGGSGTVSITGLPFPVAALANNQAPQGGAVLFARNFSSNFPSSVATDGSPNSTSLLLWYRSAANGALDTAMQASSLGTAADGNWLVATLFYQTT